MLQDIRETLYFDKTIKFTHGVTVYGHGHWIFGFGITNLLTNEEIIPIIPFFHLQKIEETEDALKIKFRIYPEGDKFYEIEVNPFKKKFKYNNIFYSTEAYYKTITGEDWK